MDDGAHDSSTAIQPTINAPIGTYAPGAPIYGATVWFDDGSARVFVSGAAPVSRVDWWRAHTVDVAGAGAFILLALLACLVARVVRRPRSAGRWYCRRCNYDVSAPAPPAASEVIGPSPPSALQQCPECGTTLAPGRVVRGRARRVRLIAPLLVLGLGIAVATGVWSRGVRRYTGADAWPSAAIGKAIGWWPVSRVPVAARQVCVVHAYDLRTGREISRFDMPAWSTAQTGPSPDGRYFATSEFSADNSYSNDAVIADVQTGTVRRVVLGGNEAGFIKFQGFTADGKESVCTVTGLVGPGTTGELKVRIVTVSLETLQTREVATVTTLASKGSANSWNVPEVFAAVAPGANPEWAMYTDSGPRQGTLTIGGPNGQLDEHMEAGGSIIGAGRLTFGRGGTLKLGAGHEYAIADKTFRDVSNVSPLQWGFLSGNRLKVRKKSKGDWVMDAGKAPSATSTVEISPDGHWCAAAISETTPAGSISTRLRVWRIPEEPDEAPKP
jgi:hypothetical protein